MWGERPVTPGLSVVDYLFVCTGEAMVLNINTTSSSPLSQGDWHQRLCHGTCNPPPFQKYHTRELCGCVCVLRPSYALTFFMQSYNSHSFCMQDSHSHGGLRQHSAPQVSSGYEEQGVFCTSFLWGFGLGCLFLSSEGRLLNPCEGMAPWPAIEKVSKSVGNRKHCFHDRTRKIRHIDLSEHLQGVGLTLNPRACWAHHHLQVSWHPHVEGSWFIWTSSKMVPSSYRSGYSLWGRKWQGEVCAPPLLWPMEPHASILAPIWTWALWFLWVSG